MNTNQSIIEFYDDYIEKKYKSNDINSFSSMKHELDCFKIFDCKYSPKILSADIENNSYQMIRYDIIFGNTKRISENNIRRILFTITKEDLFKQLDEILSYLKSFGLNHRDINPGNLIFSEKERLIKLIDFYWTNTKDEKIKAPPSGINQRYGIDDEKAINLIKKEIDEVYGNIHNSVKNIKKLIQKFGEVYHNGSSKHKGKTYSKINIPYFDNILYHRDIGFEYKEIISNLSLNPKSAIDVGCASGYTTFNLIRDFRLSSMTSYEADPLVLQFLLNIKRVFCLNNVNFIGSITPKTIFPKSDLVICMNVHMWLHKEYGKDCDIIIKNLISSSKEMFFQTAGAESQGMYLVKSLTSKDIIKQYLENLGSKKVQFIRSTKYHGGLRHLFKITGE